MERKKRVYNIILNSNDTKSYTGTRENAQYFVNFNNVMDAEALRSSYLVRFRITSVGINSSGYNNLMLIVLNLGFSSCTYNMSNNSNSRLAGTVSFISENNIATNTNIYRMDSSLEYNPPMYIDNLATTNVINFNLYDMALARNFPAAPNYVCILSFEEQ